MDEIQRVLIAQGRKDLAQKYYEKVAASYPGRAWEGKLEKVDKYLQAVYEKMTATDKQLKDSVFHAYYRHYNDGDFKSLPYGTLQRIGLSEAEARDLKEAKSWKVPTRYQAAIEKAVDVTIKYLFGKYRKVLNRQKVYFQRYQETAKDIVDSNYKSSYWLEEFGKLAGDIELRDFAKKLKELNKGVSLTKDLKSLPDKDVERIKVLIKKRLDEKRSLLGLEDIVASKTAMTQDPKKKDFDKAWLDFFAIYTLMDNVWLNNAEGIEETRKLLHAVKKDLQMNMNRYRDHAISEMKALPHLKETKHG